LEEILIFAGKMLLVVLSLGGLIVMIAAASRAAGPKSEVEMDPLHEQLQDIADFLKSATLNKSQRKQEKKKQKAKAKEQEKKESKDASTIKPRLFVLEFKGDIKASQVEDLREEVSAILLISEAQDEVLLKLESPGGMVTGYGLAASQLQRLRDKGLKLTIAVDNVAASGGYMMACVGSEILAAPFAIVGSIGVVAQVPNFHKLLKKNEIDYKEYTSGEYKRTVSMLGEITPKGEEKFLAQLEDTHILFKDFVSRHRPQADMASLGTGEYWYGERALGLKLVDKIMTSDDYLLNAFKAETLIYKLKYRRKKNISEKISEMLALSLEKGFTKALNFSQEKKFF
jgi:serine protease SohB